MTVKLPKGVINIKLIMVALAANATSKWPQLLPVTEAMSCFIYREIHTYRIAENTKFSRMILTHELSLRIHSE